MLDQLRKELNELDQQIMALLEKRFEITEKVGDFKFKENMVILQPERETEIIERLKKELKDSPYSDYIVSTYISIFEQSRQQQAKYAALQREK